MATANPFIAGALQRSSDPTFGLRVDVTREQREEERLEAERLRNLEKRERKREFARGVGRLAGSTLGFILGGPAGAGVGSAIGQKAATIFAPGANPTFKKIGPGRYFVDEGRERETQFRAGVRDLTRNLDESILTSAIFDTISAVQVKKLGGPQGILDLILDSKGGGSGGTRVPDNLYLPPTAELGVSYAN